MNWQAKHLTTVDKERIWKEYVSKEAEHRGVYDEYRQRVTEKTRDPEIKISPRGKRFIGKEPFGIKMELNPQTGRMTPVLTDRVLKSTNSPTRLRQEKEREERLRLTKQQRHTQRDGGDEEEGGYQSVGRVDSNNSTVGGGGAHFTSSFNSSSSGGGGGNVGSGATRMSDGLKLPALTLSSSALLQQQQQQHQQQQQTSSSPTTATSPTTEGRVGTTASGQSPTAAQAGRHFIYARGSPRKGPNSDTQSALQQQFLLNNFSSSSSPHHGGGNGPDASLDKSLKNLQFLATSSSAIGRGTVEMLQGMQVGGVARSPYAKSGATSPTNTNINTTVKDSSNTYTNEKGTDAARAVAVVGEHTNDFGSTLSGSLRATYLSSTTSPLKKRNEYVPGSPRSYIVTDKAGAPVLFDYGKKQCDITKMHQELPLRK